MTIERVELAIAKALADTKSEHPAMTRAARAALDAIAEPTPEMVAAGNECRCRTDSMAAFWRAMHAAMMKETN